MNGLWMMTATGVAVSLGLGTFSNCYCYPVPVKELLFSTTRIRNRSRKKRFGFGQKRFCVGAANANHEFDPELRSVLELATDSELYEIEAILFGPSYLSPLLKSIPLAFTNTNTNDDLDRSMIGVDLGLRQQFIAALESRFFFLAADARSTLREESSQGQATLQHGLSQWKVQSKVGAQDIPSILLKGGGVFTLSKIYQLLARKLSGKVLVEAANYQVKKELVKKNPEQPCLQQNRLWGTFLADLVIQMLGTDYARILRTIYALAQIRVIRTYRLSSEVTDE
ncbi:hypothetical protein HKD37_08G021134 [Glycine soja]